MDYPNDRDVLETFECEHTIRNTSVLFPCLLLCFPFLALSSLFHRYKFSHIQLTTKALIASTKTVSPSLFPLFLPFLNLWNHQSIRTAEDGLVSFQLMIPLWRGKGGVSHEGFVEFLVRWHQAHFSFCLEADFRDFGFPSAFLWMKITESVSSFAFLYVTLSLSLSLSSVECETRNCFLVSDCSEGLVQERDVILGWNLGRKNSS